MGLCVSRGASFSDTHKGPAWALPVSEWRRGTRQKDTMQPKTSLKFIHKNCHSGFVVFVWGGPGPEGSARRETLL